jgi:glycosyltransferase involved in cell wall biosynthesis
MRITIVQGPFFPVPPLLGGAVEKVWFALGTEFSRLGHEVTHISRQYGDLPHDQITGGVHHIRVRGYDAPRSKIMWRLLDLRYALSVRGILPDADILITNSIWLPAVVRAARHGALYVHVGRFPKGQTRLLYQHAARLQTVSNAVARAIIAQDSKSAARVRVIPYPLPHELRSIDVRSSWDRRERSILYVGRVHPEKGIGLLVAAFRLLVRAGLEGWRLVIVGPWESRLGGGGRHYYESLRRESRDVEQQVEWVGPLFGSGALTSYYTDARLFVYPSLAERGESFGLAPLEAMACGCPALVSALGCFEDFIRDGYSGFVFDHRSPVPAETLCSRLKEILADEKRLLAAAVRAYESATDFALPKVADSFVQDFFAIVSRRANISELQSPESS